MGRKHRGGRPAGDAGATEAAGDPRGLFGLPADAERRELSRREALALLCDAEMDGGKNAVSRWARALRNSRSYAHWMSST
jgi:hypothetical protein